MPVSYIDPSEIKDHPRAVVVDVRDSDYNVDGHLRRSINIPLHMFDSSQALLSGYDEIICYCQQSRQRGPYFAMKCNNLWPQKKIMVVNGGYTNVKSQLADECSDEHFE